MEYFYIVKYDLWHENVDNHLITYFEYYLLELCFHGETLQLKWAGWLEIPT